MKTISSITETKVILSDEGDKRYEYTKVMGKEKGKEILLILLNASGNSNINTMDTTTNLTVNNLTELGYTTITVWNLFPIITTKLNSQNIILDDDNFNYLRELIKRKFDTILIGWGNSFSVSKKVNQAKAKVHDILRPHADILVKIEDTEKKHTGKSIHPLYAGLYFNHKWELVKYTVPEPEAKTEEISAETKEKEKEKKEHGEDLAAKPDRKNRQKEKASQGTDSKNQTGSSANE